MRVVGGCGFHIPEKRVLVPELIRTVLLLSVSPPSGSSAYNEKGWGSVLQPSPYFFHTRKPTENLSAEARVLNQNSALRKLRRGLLLPGTTETV